MTKMTLRDAIDHPNLGTARSSLRDYKDRTDRVLPSDYWQGLSDLKNEAVADNDQLTAKAVWCLETAGRVQDHFVSAYLHIRADQFKQAWDRLERCGNEIGFLGRHFTEKNEEYGIEHARAHTRQLQELYPFKWGISPAFLMKEIRCSICNTKLSLRAGCDHKLGEIYDGDVCGGRITDLDILHVALVRNPAQKFSVIFPKGNDDPLFFPIKYVRDALNSPWHGWTYHKEDRRQYHPVFKDVGRNDPCPCGSTLKYKRCCLNRETIPEFPHFQFSFEKKPPIELERFVFHNMRDRQDGAGQRDSNCIS